MPTLHNRERDMSDYDEQRSEDREISLGTGTILGIFFALALLCAIFFGFGYSMGRKSAQAPSVAATDSSSTPSGGSIFSAFKPPAGQTSSTVPTKKDPASTAANRPSDPDAEIVTSVQPSADDTQSTQKQAPAPARSAVGSLTEEPPAPIVRQPARTSPVVAATASQPAAMPATTPTGTTMVQIAAVSHQEDADVLLAALKKKGYAVFIRQEPQDHLLHVQVGPFATKKDADAMRQRLLSDGYNAIVK